MINGCVAKNEFETKSPTRVVVATNQVQSKNLWKKVIPSKPKKEDCIDCYASPLDYSKPPSASNNMFAKLTTKPVKRSYREEKVINTKYYGAYDYTEKASDTTVKTRNDVTTPAYVAPAVSYVNSSYGTYSSDITTAIQVGAFRKYSGAKVYMKRYNALSSKYKVTIKTGRKNNEPLHRVRIEGFKNKAEAKKFMYSYGITDAFVVIK